MLDPEDYKWEVVAAYLTAGLLLASIIAFSSFLTILLIRWIEC